MKEALRVIINTPLVHDPWFGGGCLNPLTCVMPGPQICTEGCLSELLRIPCHPLTFSVMHTENQQQGVEGKKQCRWIGGDVKQLNKTPVFPRSSHSSAALVLSLKKGWWSTSDELRATLQTWDRHWGPV